MSSPGAQGRHERAPTYAIALLPFVLVVIVAVVALVHERATSPAVCAVTEGGATDAVAE